MKKCNEKNNDVIILTVVIFVINLICNLYKNDLNGDQLWNFQNLYKIHNGYEIYKDANIIITPLFFYIGRVFLLVFGNNMLAFNIYGTAINTMILIITYLIFKKLKISKKTSIAMIFFIYFIEFTIFINRSANYNVLALLWVLISVLMSLENNYTKVKYYNIKQGILCFLALFTKQNIGLYYLIGLTVARIFISDNKREEIKNLCKMYSVITILGIIFLIYLKISGIWDGFFYYTVSGTGEFLKNFYFDIEIFKNIDVLLPVISAIIAYILGILMIRKNKLEEIQARNIKLLMIIALPMILISFPIFCSYHIIIALFCSIVYSVYIFQLRLQKNVKRMIFICILIIIVAYCISVICYCYIMKSTNIRVTDKNSPFYGMLCNELFYNQMNKMQEYILIKEKEGINVIVIDVSSALYMVPLNKSNGKFDCFNNGNLGKDGGQGAIEEIKYMKNTEILIKTDDERVGEQEPKEVRTYIKENLEYSGEIEQFSIYRTK